jgi:protein tyrosine/serine phosphatase
LIFATACSLGPQGARPDAWATPVEAGGLDNAYRVSPQLYRSEQPDEPALVQLEDMGLKSVLNLRGSQTDREPAEATDLDLYLVEMKAGNVSEEQLFEAMKVIRDAKPPILVHCWQGSDRAGMVVAAYRVVFQGWSKEAAIDEFKNGGYGYKKFLFPNLAAMIEDLDVDRMRSELGLE